MSGELLVQDSQSQGKGSVTDGVEGQRTGRLKGPLSRMLPSIQRKRKQGETDQVNRVWIMYDLRVSSFCA